MLNFDAIAETELVTAPFKHFATTGVFSPSDLAQARCDFPEITDPGIFPLSELDCRGKFRELIGDIRSSELEEIMSAKYDVDLSDKPLMITVRGRAQKKDGRIHTDAKTKFVTCLLYLNEAWDEGGGRLRLLRSGGNIADYFAEIPPNGGTLVSFLRSENSWHGHEPYEGERRYIMFNWMTSQAALESDLRRHRVSAKAKKLNPFS
ncbi:2OG-Fe(II) oxygenase [Parvibaculaceae bacterium PLY_AMNH_Bact1]|nr:2OG-Fe(II) oxygenase [Parvibaculaceae bacterium PLY_AMNH_Bact1]